MKRLIPLLLALVMILSLATTAFAAETTGTITITPPDGVDAAATNTYKIYKVFDAVTGANGTISYKLVSGKTTAPAGFSVDAAGNVSYTGTATGEDPQLTYADITAIAGYVTEEDLVTTVTATGSNPVTTAELATGYYYITTSTGTVVTIDSTNPNAAVQDKNIVPTLEKKITSADTITADGTFALAEVGSIVNFEVTINVGDGAKGYEFHDRMSSGLSYNGDVKVYTEYGELGSNNYDTTTDEGDTITVKILDSWIPYGVGRTLTIKYSATVTSEALYTEPGKNTAWLEYGDENSNNKTPNKETSVYNAKFSVTKIDGSNQPLAGAGFVLKNADGQYYKFTPASAEGVTPVTEAKIEWVTDIANATELITEVVEGRSEVIFYGLANGTYTLVEKTVPAGYNKAEDISFTVKDASNFDAFDISNLQQSATVTNRAGSELPSTGGMGTTLFYVIGGIMVLAAVILLVTKKRMGSVE